MNSATRISLIFLCAILASVANLAAGASLAFASDSLKSINVFQPHELEIIVSNNHSLPATVVAHDDAVDMTSDSQIESTTSGSNVIAGKIAGYRVQVFSDNNQRTAKGEARTKEAKLREAFPAYNTYIVYNSPFWRLKVGDFRTRDEAEAAADAIKSHFPSFAREIRVVRDRVNK